MSILTTGKTFANGEQLSASKLNQVITWWIFDASGAVDGSQHNTYWGLWSEALVVGKVWSIQRVG